MVWDGSQLTVAFVSPALGDIVAPVGGFARDHVTFVGEPVRLIASVVELELQITVSAKFNEPLPTKGTILICPNIVYGRKSRKSLKNWFTW